MSAVQSSFRSTRPAMEWEYRLLFALTFPVFLAIACVRSALPLRIEGSGASRPMSPLARARTSASAVLPIVFMG